MTSQLKAERFPSTLHIKAEEENGLKKDSVALIFQLRAIDQKRLKDRLGQLRKNQIDKLYNEIQDLLGAQKLPITKNEEE